MLLLVSSPSQLAALKSFVNFHAFEFNLKKDVPLRNIAKKLITMNTALLKLSGI